MLVFLLSVVDELQMSVILLFVVMHWVMVTRELLFWSVNNKNKQAGAELCQAQVKLG